MNDYDLFAAEYHNFTQEAGDNTTEVELGLKVIANLLGPRIHGKVLDYGCGPGNSSRFLKSGGAKVVGVDVSQKEISIAQAYNDGIEYRVIKSSNLDALPSDFDAVVFSFVLLTIASTEEIKKILRSCRSKIKSDGRLIILNGNMEMAQERQLEFVSYAIEKLHHPQSGDPVVSGWEEIEGLRSLITIVQKPTTKKCWRDLALLSSK